MKIHHDLIENTSTFKDINIIKRLFILKFITMCQCDHIGRLIRDMQSFSLCHQDT